MSPRITLKELRLPIILSAIVILNILIYLRAQATIEPYNIIFVECVRNSGRTSAGLNLVLLLLIGHWGLKFIYQDRTLKKVMLLLFIAFAANHLIHLFFITQHFITQERELVDIAHNKRALITFISVILMPIILLSFNKFNNLIYLLILVHVFNVTLLICKLFYARYKPYDPAYMHRIGVVIMIGCMLYIIYRVFTELWTKLSVEEG